MEKQGNVIMYKTIYDIPGGEKKKKKSKARFPRDDAKFRNVARAALRQTRRTDDLETSGSRRGTRIALFKFESEKCLALVAAYKSSSSLRCLMPGLICIYVPAKGRATPAY